MKPRIVVCTTENAAWEALHCALRNEDALHLERVERLADLPRLPGASVDVAAVVIDDRFLSIVSRVESSLRRYSPVFHDTVFMTADQMLTAHWIGLFAPQFSQGPLVDWVNRTRGEPDVAAIWH